MLFKKTNLGFTLIELLVVIAIISLLSSVVISVVGKSREKANDAVSVEQSRQLKTAVELHYADKGYYPGPGGQTIRSDEESWQQVKTDLAPYISSIPDRPGNVFVYQTVACSDNPSRSCGYDLKVEKVQVTNNPNQPPVGDDNPPGGDLPPPDGGTPTGNVYYIDSISGNDSFTGRSPDQAWQTVSKVNSMMTSFLPGDSILFKRGSVWNEQLNIETSGVSDEPITFGAYSSGNKPLFDLLNNNNFGIYILDRSHLNLSNLAVRNVDGSSGLGAGIVVANSNNIILDAVDVRDVKGEGGVFVYSSNSALGKNNVIKNSVFTNITGSQSSVVSNNNGNGIHLWGECSTCGQGNIIENNSFSNNGSHGIGVFMSNTIVRSNTTFNNGESGIGVGGRLGNIGHLTTNLLIEGNTVYGNCKTRDDCFGINLFRVGSNNTIRNNNVYSQHDTFNDLNIPPNPGYDGYKFGSGGIRLDGGDKTLPADHGPGSDYINSPNNLITNNTINNEYDGIQIFNFDGGVISNNNITNSSRAGMWLGADNTQNQGITVIVSGNNVTPEIYGPVTVVEN